MERAGVKASRQQGSSTHISSTPITGGSNETTRRRETSVVAQQTQDRAITVLTNHELMMRYAIANDLVSAA